MKQFSALAFLLFAHLIVFSQEKKETLRLRNAVYSEKQNIQASKLSPELRQKMQFRNRNYVMLRFKHLPGTQQKQALQQHGIKLFDYIPGNGFFAELPSDLDLATLQPYSVNGVFFSDPSVKMAEGVITKRLGPDESIAVHYAADLSRNEVVQQLLAAGATLHDYHIQPGNIIFIKADTTAIRKVAALPFVTYVYKQTLKDEPLNYLSRGTNNLSSLADPTGRNLQGKGVTLGIGDEGDPTHLDFAGRLMVMNPAIATWHGTHTTGTMASGGLLNPKYRGMAPKATIIAHYFSEILSNTPTYISQYGMVLTNNSYSSGSSGCGGSGEYDALSNFTDQQLIVYPSLLHVFASGNDGGLTCFPYPGSFGTVRSGFQSSKNGLVVGQYNASNDLLGAGSSRGPVKDGRLKPEIMAPGIDVMSTSTNNTYGLISGTSMSAPSVTGSLALLYERYRQLHGGANPTGALIKALACNGADDMGNPGPDYFWGFGKLNARNSIEMMEQNHYFTGSVTTGNSNAHTITGIPAGASKIKVMLYWLDPAAAPGVSVALVNNLDLTVKGTDNIIHRPLILNAAPANVADNATEGTDNINNIEQVVIDPLPAGDVEVTVTGSNIPSGPQQYVVVYQVVQPVIHVDYPAGGEKMVTNESEQIRWSADDNSTNTFTIEFSPDNGSNWTTLDNAVPGNVRFYNWQAPSVAAREALIRVTRNTAGATATSTRPFTILGQPTLTLTGTCPGYVLASWPGVVDADSYEVLRLVGDSMQVIATTNATSYLIEGMPRDAGVWLAVRARINGIAGRPSVAASIQASGGTCAGTTYNNDLTVESILGLQSGRQNTASQLSNQALRIRVRNRGTTAVTGATMEFGYTINGGSPVILNRTTNVAGPGIVDIAFTPVIGFSTPGDYLIKAWVKHAPDPYAKNDTLETLIRHLPNPPITLAPFFTEGFESASEGTYAKKTFGLDGLPRAEFAATTTNGRARIAAQGYAYSGNNALLLDQGKYRTPVNTDSVTLTFNLSNYSSSDQIWLDFYYRNQGIDVNYPNNKVWIRGNANAAWIPVFTLPTEIDKIGMFRASVPVNITEALAAASQTISSSFQVRLGEQGFTNFNTISPENTLEDGITYDDIKLTKPSDDIGVRAIINPPLPSVCAMGAIEFIRVELKNYSNIPHSNIEVAYELDGTVVKEFINLNANQQLTHQFATPVNLSAFREYKIRAWVHMNGDDYVNNDSLDAFNFTTAPVINSFPYLQDFEADNGNWYTTGVNPSWEYGIPAKPVITRAANGSRAWVTRLNTPYNNSEYSYLVSPCINLNGMTQPVLSFSHIYHTEEACDCDHHWVEYTTDDKNWNKLGSFNSGTNWYNHSSYVTFFREMSNWHVSSNNLPVTNGFIRLRFVMKTDAGTVYEGVGIDDIHIFDRAPVYTGADISAGITQPVNGNGWTNFAVSNNMIVSINPQGQNLGSTTVKVFRNTGGVRNNGQQYYLDRNIVINPAAAPTSNVLVRFYFTDAEAKALMAANDCPTCTKPADPYMIGISQYSGPLPEENGTIADNTTGYYQFITPAQVNVIPYDNGYYAEFSVNHFSEFWINGGGAAQNTPLPVTLSAFTATRRNNTGLLQWQTSQELNSKQFTIEKSTDGSLFIPIGTVAAAGNSQTLQNYQFTDPVLSNGNNYYRLLITDIDGHSERSAIRNIQMSNAAQNIQVFPNPVKNGIVYIRGTEEIHRIELSDISGRVLLQHNTRGTQHRLDLHQFAKGTYMVSMYTAGGKKIQRIVLGE